MPRLSGLDRVGCFGNGRKLRGDFAAAHMPARLDPAGFDHILATDRRKAHVDRHFAGIGRDAIDLVERQPGVIKRLADGVHRQPHWRALEANTNLGLADTGDICFDLFGHVSALPLEKREPDTVLFFKGDAHPVLEVHRINRRTDDVGSEDYARGAIKPHPGNDKRHL